MKHNASKVLLVLPLLILCQAVQAKTFAECVAANNNRALEAKINAVPRDNTILLLRAAIVGIDFQINVMSQCLPDDQAQRLVDQLVNQREKALAACQSLASNASVCVQPPF